MPKDILVYYIYIKPSFLTTLSNKVEILDIEIIIQKETTKAILSKAKN